MSGCEVNEGSKSLSHGGTSARLDLSQGDVVSRLVSNRGSRSFTLEAIEKVSAHLGRPQDAFPVFHVAGTNGKGSVSCALAGILGSNGKSTVLTVSPHLERVNERIIVDGIPISDEALTTQLLRIEDACRAIGENLSLHEAMTLAAFLEGRRLGVSYGVLEVGLGGRLDSTNLTTRAHVGIITSISLDHTELLGETVEEIAAEKVAITKQTMKAMVVGYVSEGVLAVIESVCAKLCVPVFAMGRDFSVQVDSKVGYLLNFEGRSIHFEPPLPGAHQVENAALALVAGIIEGLDPDKSSVGLSKIMWPGRLERIFSPEMREVIIDCAHNPAGIERVVRYVREEVGGVVDCLFGCLSTKDWREMVKQLLPITRYWCLLQPSAEQAVPNEDIAAFLSGFGINPHCSTDVPSAIRWASAEGREADSHLPLLVVGSMYMLGAVRAELSIENRPYWLVSRVDTGI